jgi:hypothetical protein
MFVKDETRKKAYEAGGPAALSKRRGRGGDGDHPEPIANRGPAGGHTELKLVQVMKFLPKVPFFIPNLPTIYTCLKCKSQCLSGKRRSR